MANPLMDLLTPKRRPLVDVTTDPSPGQPYDLSGATTRPVAGSDYGADMPDRGPGRANDPLATLLLTNARAGELKERAINDPTDRRAAGLLSDVQGELADDPYTGQAAHAQQAANEQARVIGPATFGTPAVADMRQQQIREEGQKAQANAYGKTQGDTLAQTGDAGTILAARKQKDALANLLAGQGIVPPTPGAAGGAPPQMSAPVAQAPGTPGVVNNEDPLTTPRGQQAMAALDPQMAGVVKAILEYRYPVPQGFALGRSPQLRHVVEAVTSVDPSFDASNYEAGMKLRNDVTTGEMGQRLRAFNAASAHLIQLDQNREKMNNANVGAFTNRPVNALESLLGGTDRYSNFDATRSALEAEVGKFLAGSGGTDALRKSLGAGVSSHSSDAQIQGYIKTMAGLMHGQYQGIAQQAQPFKHLNRFVESQLTPEAQTVLQHAQSQ